MPYIAKLVASVVLNVFIDGNEKSLTPDSAWEKLHFQIQTTYNI